MAFSARLNAAPFRLPPGRKVIKAAEYQAWLEAGALVERAAAEAEAIRAGAAAALEAEKRRGYEEGTAQAKLEAAERMMDAVAGTLDYFTKVEETMVELVIGAVDRVIGELEDRELVRRVVKNALSVVRSQKQVTVRVAPDQAAAVKEQLNDILKPYPSIGMVDIVADGRLSRGGCILESDIGSVDASVEIQLEAIRRAIAKSFVAHGAGAGAPPPD
ncbi:MAG: HrpE/YscL family type III secretion apparatus protein [Dongiaceae bacterium]